MGFHLTYSPVVDISVRPENPAESVRSFSGDLGLLGRMVRAYVRGYQENGMLTTAKHFPGRGDTEPFPNYPGFSTINKPAKEVEEQEFRAFKHAIDAGVTFVMSEHIAVPSVTDGSDLPASVEKKLATEWLRDKLGFKGILTTDDLWYDQVIKRFGPVEVAIKAIVAGHDIILKPKDPSETIQGLVAAVKSGRREFLSVWNQAWFSSLRSASGLYLHARGIGDEELLRKARLTKELALAAHMKDGIFPTVIGTENVMVEIHGEEYQRPRGWEHFFWGNSNRSPRDHGIFSDWYHVLDCSWTALLMLRWYQELEKDERLLDYAGI